MSGEISFRRIKGRIVPIKLSRQQQRDVAIGTSLTAVGGVASFASGKTYRKVLNFGIKNSAKGFNLLERASRIGSGPQMSFHQMQRAQRMQGLGLKLLKRGERVSMALPFIRKGLGIGVGSGIAGYGLMKLAKGLKKDLTAEQGFAISAAGSSAAFYGGMYGRSAWRAARPTIMKAGKFAIKTAAARFL